MELGVILQVLVLALCSSVGHAASLDACLKVLLSEEFHTTCSALGRNHTRPCLVQSEDDVNALKRAKVIRHKMVVSRNKICAARIEEGEADCVSVHLKCNQQQNWQWTEWAGTSPSIARRFTITEGSTNTLCPYEERYFTPEVLTSCLDVLNHGYHTSGVYTISPDGNTLLDVYCEQDLDGGGWTVIQRRQDGLVDFYLTWAGYKAGFGDLEGEFWLGNDKIHLLTKNQDQQVKFHLKSTNGEVAWANFFEFWIGDEAEKYKLHIAQYIGATEGANPAGDSMVQYHNGKIFSTKDQDNDGDPRDCAELYFGGWWYGTPVCHTSNLNGLYGNTDFAKGPVWHSWKGHYEPLAFTAIMLRSTES